MTPARKAELTLLVGELQGIARQAGRGFDPRARASTVLRAATTISTLTAEIERLEGAAHVG
jgi:hypothetical protein